MYDNYMMTTDSWEAIVAMNTEQMKWLLKEYDAESSSSSRRNSGYWAMDGLRWKEDGSKQCGKEEQGDFFYLIIQILLFY